MKITLEKGHHHFGIGKERDVLKADGSKVKTSTVSPGDTFEVTKKEFDGMFKNRSRYAAPAEDEAIQFDPAWLKAKTVKQLKAIAKDLGAKGYSNASEEKLIDLIMEFAPEDEEPVIEWGADRLKAYLAKAEIDFDEESNLLELAINHFNA